MMKTVLALALFLDQAQAQDAPECHATLFGALTDHCSDCSACDIASINTVLCPGDVCCTVSGVAQAAGVTVGTTAPTICASSSALDTCSADGAACSILGHTGTCNAQMECVDTTVCSAAKIAQRDLCADDCTACTADHIDIALNGCTLADGTAEAYGTTFCVTPTCTAMDLAAIQAAGYTVAGAGDATTTDGLGAVSCHTTHVAEDASGAATTPSVSCDGTDFAWTGCTPEGSCSTDAISCPNSNQLATYNTANGADEASCCEAVPAVAGKCGGNADSATDYTCPTGYDLKANPSSIDSASTDDAATRTAACCDAQTCATDVCTAGYDAKTDQTLAAGTAATLENCCDAQTCATDVCTTGYAAKTDQTLAAGTAATLENCCDAVVTPPPADPAASSATTTAVTAAALLGVALAHLY